MALTSTGGVPHADWFDSAAKTVEVFRRELLSNLKSNFQGFFGSKT
jgi:hypothetical protein